MNSTPSRLPDNIPLLVRPNDACGLIGISRTKLFELIRVGPQRGGIESELLGTRTRVIPRRAIEDWANNLPARLAEYRQLNPAKTPAA